MGMDVYSRTNGAYFRASIWDWPSIYELCVRANKESNLEFDMTSWEWNDGAGLTNKEDCLALADSIESIIYPCKANAVFPSKFGSAVGDSLRGALGLEKVEYATCLEHVKEFVSFLRACDDGFRIW